MTFRGKEFVPDELRDRVSGGAKSLLSEWATRLDDFKKDPIEDLQQAYSDFHEFVRGFYKFNTKSEVGELRQDVLNKAKEDIQKSEGFKDQTRSVHKLVARLNPEQRRFKKVPGNQDTQDKSGRGA